MFLGEDISWEIIYHDVMAIILAAKAVSLSRALLE
jgi:hypothetical protein